MKKVVCFALLIPLLSGCSSRVRDSYVSEYQQAVSGLTGVAVTGSEPVERFKALYGDLKGNNLDERIDAVYAETLYFNDTLHTFRERSALRDYLKKTAQRVDSINVSVDHILVDGNDVWLNWRMQTRARALGRTMEADTIGMTHLRFDVDGRVVLHQDYWDSTEGLFIHIPVIGGLVRWTRNRL
jgi:ketosteroid isomerase-like protein